MSEQGETNVFTVMMDQLRKSRPAAFLDIDEIHWAASLFVLIDMYAFYVVGVFACV
jgi:hypothetical protein